MLPGHFINGARENMAKKAAIPQDNRERPDYEYRPFPKWIGRDEFGQDLVANSAEEVEDLQKRRVYPMDLGLDKTGALVRAMHPDEVTIKKTQVSRPIDKVAETSHLPPGKTDDELREENERLRAELAATQEKPTAEGRGGKKKAA